MTEKANSWSDRLHNVIPAGAHTYSRGDDQFPAIAPAILKRGKGAYVWDPEGNRFLDYGMALRAVTLGYADDRVNQAAIEQANNGVNLTRASYIELEAAEKFVDLIPSADMVKFAKNGSNVTTAALKLARAYTGRKYVARCRQNPFFSFDDWFIGTTTLTRGVPEEYHSLTLQFDFNNISSLERLFEEFPGQIAAVITEPVGLEGPCAANHGQASHDITKCKECANGYTFLQQVSAVCKKHGAVFVLDEMITGFRWHARGAQAYFNVTPDLSTFGKGMANGYSVAALAGKRDIMELGGIRREGQERVFLVSTTHGAEMTGMGALSRTIDIYKTEDVTGHLWKYGSALKSGINQIASELGVGEYFSVTGYPCSPGYTALNRSGSPDPGLRTLFVQEMVRSQVLMPWIALSLSHGDTELNITLEAARKALKIYGQALDHGFEKYLIGEPVKPVFRKYN